jgi:hypothetical protein
MASQDLMNQDCDKRGDNPEMMITERRMDYILSTPMAQPVSHSTVDAPKPPQVLEELRGESNFDGTKVGDNPEYMLSKRVV